LLFNSKDNFFDDRKYSNKTNTKLYLAPKRSSGRINILSEKPIFDNCNDNTPIKDNKEEMQMDLDETDIFIQKLLKEEESLIKLQIKIKLEEEKNQILLKEVEKSKDLTYLV